MARMLAFANQKGGVGKTTSAVNIAAEFAQRGHSVLLFDLDPQCNASSGLGVMLDESAPNIFDLFVGQANLAQLIKPTTVKGLDLVPSTKDLVSLELEIGKQPGRELILKSQLSLLPREYDFIFFDCPPSSGLLSLNALGAAEGVIIPLQAEYYALEGLSGLIHTIQFVQQTFNPGLSIFGVFMTMFDSRTKLAAQVEKEAGAFFGDVMLQSRIRRSVKLSEAPSHGIPIQMYDASSSGAADYRALTDELMARLGIGNLERRAASNS